MVSSGHLGVTSRRQGVGEHAELPHRLDRSPHSPPDASGGVDDLCATNAPDRPTALQVKLADALHGSRQRGLAPKPAY